ncbi:hypothetical protein [Chitinophaga arvensicola]|uniref:Uncharacterized protein n=1 Tax=Chitinophaga arvensicola TaxID=29529 RepID=A0A1I0SA29_9BACT|nr:hypothetical protein [Chitinophaga arvensicola]SEW53163.1 hypothetical protein SAMN04488122_5358 [Chitinophaga arvensicola]
MKKLFTICCILTVLLSCNESKLSKGPVGSLSLLRAEISITQRLYSKIENQVVVMLYDEDGRKVKNDSIKIYVNGDEVKYTVRQELYYTTSTYYLKDSANPRNDQFNFEIVLPNGQRSFLAEVGALDLVNGQNISYTEKGNLNKDYEITWKELTGVNYLSMERSMKVKKQEEPNITTVEEWAPDTISIHPTGRYVVSKSTYEDSTHLLNILSFKFIVQKNGKVSEELAKGSWISIMGNVERSVSFE